MERCDGKGKKQRSRRIEDESERRNERERSDSPRRSIRLQALTVTNIAPTVSAEKEQLTAISALCSFPCRAMHFASTSMRISGQSGIHERSADADLYGHSDLQCTAHPEMLSIQLVSNRPSHA
jgi:hypothetical protein